MKYEVELVWDGGLKPTTFVIDEYGRRIARIEIAEPILVEHGRADELSSWRPGAESVLFARILNMGEALHAAGFIYSPEDGPPSFT